MGTSENYSLKCPVARIRLQPAFSLSWGLALKDDPTSMTATDAVPVPDWRITGDWWDLCNCAIGCPCNFGSNPTYGFCEGVLTWLIREGNYGDLIFAKDLAVVLIIHWEGNVFEKNREFGFLIDDRANPEERVALVKIFTGYAGGAFEAWRDLTLKLDGVQFVPMAVTHDAENWRVEVPGMVDGLGGPFRKYMVPEGGHLPHLQCAASRGRAWIPHRRSGQAQHRHRCLRTDFRLVRAILKAHRVRSARPEVVQLAQIA